MCSEGKIEGTTKVGNVWAITDSAEKPIDQRIKSGGYISIMLEAKDKDDYYIKFNPRKISQNNVQDISIY